MSFFNMTDDPREDPSSFSRTRWQPDESVLSSFYQTKNRQRCRRIHGKTERLKRINNEMSEILVHFKTTGDGSIPGRRYREPGGASSRSSRSDFDTNTWIEEYTYFHEGSEGRSSEDASSAPHSTASSRHLSTPFPGSYPSSVNSNSVPLTTLERERKILIEREKDLDRSLQKANKRWNDLTSYGANDHEVFEHDPTIDELSVYNKIKDTERDITNALIGTRMNELQKHHLHVSEYWLSHWNRESFIMNEKIKQQISTASSKAAKSLYTIPDQDETQPSSGVPTFYKNRELGVKCRRNQDNTGSTVSVQIEDPDSVIKTHDFEFEDPPIRDEEVVSAMKERGLNKRGNRASASLFSWKCWGR